MKTKINIGKRLKAVKNAFDARRFRKMSGLETKLMKAERDLNYKDAKKYAFELRDYATKSMRKATSDEERNHVQGYIDKAKQSLYELTINHAI